MSAADGPAWLQALFAPRSVAVVGASDNPVKLSGRPIDYLQRFGYKGAIYPVNSSRDTVQGLKAYPSLAAIDDVPDLAMLLVSSKHAAEAVRECGRLGIPAAIVGAAGFAELGEDGSALQEELRQAVAESGLRVLGPNCLGLIATRSRCAPTFTSALDEGTELTIGNAALISQSGAFGTFIFSAAQMAGVGFSHFANTGNEVDLDVVELLEALADDPEVSTLIGYLEGLTDGTRLLHLGQRALAEDKPVILSKVGRTDAGARAVSSHTASLVGADDVFDDVCRQAGILRVESVNDMVDVAAIFDGGRRTAGDRLTILTLSGGAAALMTDVATANGIQVNEWEPEWQAKIAPAMPSFGSPANPIDLTAELIRDPEILDRALRVAVEHPGTDIACVLVGNASRCADRLITIIDEVSQTTDKPIVVVWTGDNTRPMGELARRGIARYDDPGRAARAIGAMVTYARSRASSVRVGEQAGAGSDGLATATGALADARQAGRARLDELAAGEVLSSFGVPVAAAAAVRDADEAWAQAQRVGLPVAVKVVSADVAHKTEVGGVVVGLGDEDAVRSAYTSMAAVVDRLDVPDGRVMVQAMAGGGMADQLELVVGAHRDPTFGMVVTVGLGGVLVELLGDTVSMLPPVTPEAAEAALRRLRGAPLFDEFRGRAARDIHAAAELVAAFSRAVRALDDHVDEVELNPVLVGATGRGATAVDALVALRREGG